MRRASKNSSAAEPRASHVASNHDADPPRGAEASANRPQAKAPPVLDPDHFAKLAHELKTPLTAIAAAAEIMRDERLGEMGNERYLGYAADIHESATHALNVITALLTESRGPSAAEPRLVALDLNAIVERTVSSVQALAEARGLALIFDADESRPHVIANPTAMRQILLNLLTNAIKFTPPGGDVRVATGYIDDGRVFLVVRDTGCGMSGSAHAVSEALPTEACEPWVRGNGIGLPLVQRLVREMGAAIEIDSERAKGTVVLIAFDGSGRWSV
jgi:signal transduction histidine kinase